MKPPNTRPPLLLEDNAPVRCVFMARTDAPLFWERCEQDATERLSQEGVAAFKAWLAETPKAIIRLYPSDRYAFLCDRHLELLREIHAVG